MKKFRMEIYNDIYKTGEGFLEKTFKSDSIEYLDKKYREIFLTGGYPNMNCYNKKVKFFENATNKQFYYDRDFDKYGFRVYRTFYKEDYEN